MIPLLQWLQCIYFIRHVTTIPSLVSKFKLGHHGRQLYIHSSRVKQCGPFNDIRIVKTRGVSMHTHSLTGTFTVRLRVI